MEFSFSVAALGENEIYLYDAERMCAFDLKQSPVYDYMDQGGKKRNFTILVGTHEYVAKATGGRMGLPKDFALGQNFPNPFNPATRISYQLAGAGLTALKLYNLEGRLVTNIVNEFKEAGYYSAVWDGKDHAGRQVAAGIYIYRLVVQGNGPRFEAVKKMSYTK
jgi:hypothetical protein